MQNYQKRRLLFTHAHTHTHSAPFGGMKCVREGRVSPRIRFLDDSPLSDQPSSTETGRSHYYFDFICSSTGTIRRSVIGSTTTMTSDVIPAYAVIIPKTGNISFCQM